MDAPVTACLPPPILKPSGFGAVVAVVLPGVCLFTVDVARRVVRCLISFSSFLALDSRSVVLFSCLPSRFAQENASVARHESARLPRPPLPLLLAHGTLKPNSFSYSPNTFFFFLPPSNNNSPFSRREAQFVYYYFFLQNRRRNSSFVCFLFAFFFCCLFYFFTVSRKAFMGIIGGKILQV